MTSRPLGRLRRTCRRRPVAALLTIAILLELLLIPLFLVTGADARIEAGLAAAGHAFNTDLVTMTLVAIAAPVALPGLLLALAQVASPDLALLIVVLAGFGVAGLRPLRRRLVFWNRSVGARTGLRVWATVVVVFCGMNVASGLLHRAVLGAGGHVWDVDPLGVGLLLALLITMFLDAGAVFEENAWRGFALPLLQRSHAPLTASVLLGVAWSAWHVPVKFTLALDHGPGGFVAVFGVLTVKFVLLSIIMTHFFNRVGESTLLAVAMHGLSNDAMRLGGFAQPVDLRGELLAELNLVAPMAVVAAVLVIVTRGRLGSRTAGRAGVAEGTMSR